MTPLVVGSDRSSSNRATTGTQIMWIVVTSFLFRRALSWMLFCCCCSCCWQWQGEKTYYLLNLSLTLKRLKCQQPILGKKIQTQTWKKPKRGNKILALQCEWVLGWPQSSLMWRYKSDRKSFWLKITWTEQSKRSNREYSLTL